MGKNLIASFIERPGNLIAKVASPFAGDPEVIEQFFHEERDPDAPLPDNKIKRPSWSDMLKYYPDDTVLTEDLYDEIGGGLPESYVSNPFAWENSCAIRMSKALNYSGIKLGKAPSKDGHITGKDKYKYWIRVKDLKKYLIDNLDKPDVKEQGAPGIVDKFKNKKGIIVFDVSGWGNATGHFTLWDGTNLKYVGADTEHNDPNDAEMYYFHMKYQAEDAGGNLLFNKDGTPKMVKTETIRLWELT